MKHAQTFGPLMLSATLLGSLMLGGCGEAKNDTTADGASAMEERGTLQIAITDAEEDFLTYRIEIDSINLVREDGTEVSVLPASTDVDFVQYQELSELFASLAVPRGTYTSVTLDLDYSEADIVIQDDSGNSLSASVVDDMGANISEFEVALQLNDSGSLVVTPGRIAHVTLDLDLGASNTILSTTPAVVQVEPYMLATAIVDEEREHRVRSLLNSVDTENNLFNVDILPMRLRSGRGQYGDMDIHVSDETAYEIDGVEYTGSAGLNAMNLLDVDTPVVSYGQAQDGQVNASIVVAGSSVAWADQDVLKGVITARSDNTLTLSGAVVEPEDGRAVLMSDITLTVGDDTQVTGYRLGDATLANLSVGQRVLALGQFADESDASLDASFDATAGTVRMKANGVIGEVTQTSPLVMDVSQINKRRVGVFDTSGTGVDAANDADLDAYEFETGSLNISNLTVGDWISVKGYPTAFGSAPMDFDATTIVKPDLSNVDAKYNGLFLGSDDSNTVTIENDQLVLADAFRDSLKFKGLRIELSEEVSLTHIAGSAETGRYAIRSGGIRQGRRHMEMYLNYDDFIAALADHVDSGKTIAHLISSGAVDAEADPEASVMTATHITVKLK